MIELTDQLEQSAKDWVLKHLAYDSSNPKVKQALQIKSASGLLAIYLNWDSRFIRIQPRTVHKSNELNAKLVGHPKKPEIEKLLAKIEAGGDLSLHLSKKTQCGFTLNKKPIRNHRAQLDLDMLLNDWGVYHLHLSVQHAKELLFAIFRGDSCFVIDIQKHNFEKLDLREIAISNWPDENLFIEVMGVELAQPNHSEEDVFCLRKASLDAPFFYFSGKVYTTATGGITSSGVSTQSAERANSLIRQIRHFEHLLRDDPNSVKVLIERTGRTLASPMDFSFSIVDGKFCIVEQTTNTAIPFN